jgi:hypothetical protein
MDSAMEAVNDGAMAARDGIAGAIPAIGRFVSRFVYTSSYCVSYGVVYPVMLVVRMVPTENSLVHGLIDGTNAAVDQVYGTRESEEDIETATDEQPLENDQSDHAVPAPPRRRASRRGGSQKRSRSAHKN